jgi:hypothetical protein
MQLAHLVNAAVLAGDFRDAVAGLEAGLVALLPALEEHPTRRIVKSVTHPARAPTCAPAPRLAR